MAKKQPTKATSTRTEKDTMGSMEVPRDALYGASTQRAVLNFPVSGRPVPFGVVRAYALLKAAAAQVNAELGRLEKSRASAIVKACKQIEGGLEDHGGWERHFPVDIYQTGSGTSTNMNANEVVANLVCLARGAKIGSSKDAEYLKKGGIHPNDHVNMGQSSNDTFPTAIHIAAATAIHADLLPAIRAMHARLKAQAKAWNRIVKIGRTHLQDATPIRLGQEFAGYAQQMAYAERRAEDALKALSELAIGGTAVGTGINTHPKFDRMVCAALTEAVAQKGLKPRDQIKFRPAKDHCEANHARDAVVEASGQMKVIATSLSKIANDIRLMGCGPRCGIGELKIPAVQPGSSIMPGKVNPVICEMAMMVACQVIGNDAAVTAGNLGGVGSILDLNVAMPMMAANLLGSIELLAGACRTFTTNCLDHLEPDEARCAELIEGSLAMCTSLVPVIGYDKSAALAKQAFAEGKTVREVALEQEVLSAAELKKLLNPMSMTKPS